ncbi:MAG: AMP-binding protein, partial [Acidimicrobiales bacterium]
MTQGVVEGFPAGEGAPGVLTGRSVALEPGTIVDAVAAHAGARPDAPALYEGDQVAQSYAELWRDASGLAGALQEAGVVRGDQVAIWATRSAPVVAAALAAMALGAAYLPIDPTYPAARVRRILEVGAPRVIVCADARALAGSLPRGVPVVDLHAGTRWAPVAAPAATPDDVAYTVFMLRATYATPGGLAAAESGLVLTGAVAVRTAVTAARYLRLTRRQALRQARTARLVGRPEPALGAVLVEHSQPAAYCIAGRHPTVILTTAALRVLAPGQLEAVMAH